MSNNNLLLDTVNDVLSMAETSLNKNGSELSHNDGLYLGKIIKYLTEMQSRIKNRVKLEEESELSPYEVEIGGSRFKANKTAYDIFIFMETEDRWHRIYIDTSWVDKIPIMEELCEIFKIPIKVI